MKKFLLFICAAVVAVSASAQQYAKVSNDAKSLVFAKQPKKNTKVNVIPEVLAKVKNTSVLKSSVKKAPAMENVYGNYVEDMMTETLWGDMIHACSEASLAEFEFEGEKYINLVLDGGMADILGEYDPETGVLDCGAQYCYEHPNYGAFAILGLVYAEDGYDVTEDLSFTIDDDNYIYCNQDGYVILLQEGAYAGYTWDGFHEGVTLFPSNATQYVIENSNATGGWAPVKYNVGVADYETQVNVYSFCGYGLVYMDINDDLTVSMPTGQPVADLLSEAQDPDGVYGTLNIVAVSLDRNAGTIRRNYNQADIKGKLVGNTITFVDVDDANLYFAIATNQDAEEAAYGLGWYTDLEIVLNEGEYLAAGSAGITENTVTREEKIKNTKTYNMLGQQVNRDAAKGLLIRDGKKYIKK